MYNNIYIHIYEGLIEPFENLFSLGFPEMAVAEQLQQAMRMIKGIRNLIFHLISHLSSDLSHSFSLSVSVSLSLCGRCAVCVDVVSVV